jgi:diacylglycerol kinase family enzyme
MDGAPRCSGAFIRVQCEAPVTVHADGEDIGQTPVDIYVKSAALRLVRFSDSQSELG